MKKIILISLLLVSLSLLIGCVKEATEEGSDGGALAGQAVRKITPVSCVDNDDGKNKDVKGTVTYVIKDSKGKVLTYNYPDMCLATNKNSVKEYFCNGKNYKIKNLACDTGAACINGACAPICTDSDGGDNVLVKGEISGPNWLDTPTEIVTDEDYCIVGGEKDGRQVEFYCELDEDGISKVRSRSNECSNDESCKKGVCEANRFCYYLDAAGNRLPAGTRQNDIITDSEGRRYFGIVTEEGTFLPECKNSGVGVGPETVGQVGGYFCGAGTTSFSSGPGVTKSSEVNAIYGCSQGISCRDGACINLCGDGVLDVGESCDDGNTNDGDDCPANCVVPQNWCGNGVCDPGEETTCTSDCMGFCGNGICDPTENSDICSGDCVVASENLLCGQSVSVGSTFSLEGYNYQYVSSFIGLEGSRRAKFLDLQTSKDIFVSMFSDEDYNLIFPLLVPSTSTYYYFKLSSNYFDFVSNSDIMMSCDEVCTSYATTAGCLNILPPPRGYPDDTRVTAHSTSCGNYSISLETCPLSCYGGVCY